MSKYLLKPLQCSGKYFSCDNGLCIPFEKRCNQVVDCRDASDENSCTILDVDDTSYNAR